MPTTPDTPCVDCGRLVWVGRHKAPARKRVCPSCRQRRRQARGLGPSWVPETLACARCGVQFEQHRAGQLYCTAECRDRGRHGVGRTNSTERGYGAQHQAKRAEWAPKVARGEVECHAVICLELRDGGDRWIESGMPWDLGHTPDRARWTGPEHARCNRSEGATRGNRQRDPARAAQAPPRPAEGAGRWVL